MKAMFYGFAAAIFLAVAVGMAMGSLNVSSADHQTAGANVRL